jgi:hypothetical protein
MVYFKTITSNLCTFWAVLQWKIFVYFMDILSILWPFDIFYGHLVYFVVIWYIFPVLVYRSKKNRATANGNCNFVFLQTKFCPQMLPLNLFKFLDFLSDEADWWNHCDKKLLHRTSGFTRRVDSEIGAKVFSFKFVPKMQIWLFCAVQWQIWTRSSQQSL